MICRSADGHRLHVVRPGNTAYVGPEFGADVVTDGVKATFGGEDAMDELGDVGVGHDFSRPSGTLKMVTEAYPAINRRAIGMPSLKGRSFPDLESSAG